MCISPNFFPFFSPWTDRKKDHIKDSLPTHNPAFSSMYNLEKPDGKYFYISVLLNMKDTVPNSSS